MLAITFISEQTVPVDAKSVGQMRRKNIGAAVITDDEKLACVRRELKMRQGAYPRFIALGQLSKEKADHEIACMASIAADYEEATKGERLI